MTVPTTTLVELWQTLVETLEMWHTLVLLAGFVASQRFPSGSTGSVATLSSAAWVLFAGGPVARWRNRDAPLFLVRFLACAISVHGHSSRSTLPGTRYVRYPNLNHGQDVRYSTGSPRCLFTGRVPGTRSTRTYLGAK